MLKKICIYMLAFSIIECVSSSDAVKSSKNPKGSLIPRSVLLAKPDRFCVTMSHDGGKIAYVARNGSEIEVRIEDLSGKLLMKFPIKPSRSLGEFGLVWMFTNSHILVLQDKNGDENYQVYCYDVSSGKSKSLTPFDGAKSHPQRLSREHPRELIISCNKRDPKWFDAYRVNIDTGKMDPVFQNDEYGDFIFDPNFNLRIVSKTMPDGSEEHYEMLNGKPKLFKKVPFEDSKNSRMLYFSFDCKTLYGLDSSGRDKSALVAYDLKNKTSKVLFHSDFADAQLSAYDPNTYVPQMMTVYYTEPEDVVIDDRVSKDAAYLKSKFGEGRFVVRDRNLVDNRWLIISHSDTLPARYYVYERDPQKHAPLSLKYLFSSQSALEKYQLQEMTPVVIKSRDGLDLVCYLTKSFDYKEGQPSKMVVLVHGGPWARDDLSFDKEVQLLANRGYSVLQVNYRGSLGFGKAFINAADGSLHKIRDDIVDGVNWAIENNIADRNQIAIMGGSFGGYSTLAGLAFTPDVFSCGVDIVGPSNWITTMRTFPKYWFSDRASFYKLLGDPHTAKGRALAMANSPISRVNDIKKPLIVIQGEHDPRVNKAESDQMVAAMKKNGLDVTYVLYPDEGHGFHREPNVKSYLAITEKFLSEKLGGWYEPIHDKELEGSSHKVLEGKI
jgi:dipeptidyl aminopeptidase/acylaminoacyl peptidase